MTNNVFFSVGEPSGDLHAASLIEALRANDSTIGVRGLGGSKMVDAGLQQDYDLTDLAVVGFVEVLPKLREFFRVKAMAKKIFLSEKIDAVVLVDFPGFNWHIAKLAQRSGIPVFYYLPPQLWAWGKWRIGKMKRSVDHVLCALPMEYEFFRQHGLDCELVGHPFFEHVQSHILDNAWLEAERRQSALRLAVLPGSRRREVENIFPLQLLIAEQLTKRFPNLQFEVACLNESFAAKCHEIAREKNMSHLPIRFHVNKTSEVIELCDCVLTKSGSVSLELLARQKAANVIYHGSRSTYEIATRLTDVKFMTLPNIIADREIIPEFLAIGKSTAIVSKVIESMSRLLGNVEARTQQIDALQSVYQQCGGDGASTRAANAIFDRMGWSKQTVEVTRRAAA